MLATARIISAFFISGLAPLSDFLRFRIEDLELYSQHTQIQNEESTVVAVGVIGREERERKQGGGQESEEPVTEGGDVDSGVGSGSGEDINNKFYDLTATDECSEFIARAFPGNFVTPMSEVCLSFIPSPPCPYSHACVISHLSIPSIDGARCGEQKRCPLRFQDIRPSYPG